MAGEADLRHRSTIMETDEAHPGIWLCTLTNSRYKLIISPDRGYNEPFDLHENTG
jgi:hypothetical protein